MSLKSKTINMQFYKKWGLAIAVFVLTIGITWALKAQQKPPEKHYNVSLSYQGWVQLTNQLEYVKNYMRHTKLPSDEVSFVSDSVLTPIQALIGSQVSAQLEAEKAAAPVKKDSTSNKSKKN